MSSYNTPDTHPIDYNDRYFRSVENSASGEVDGATRFHYRQRDDLIWATYAGGAIRFGTLVGTADSDGRLTFTYQHLNSANEFMSGHCRSTPERLPDGRLRLHERWQWTTGDHSAGESIIEEVPEPASIWQESQRPIPPVERLPERFAICRLAPDAPLPAWASAGGSLLAVTRTADELSIVCPQARAAIPAEIPTGAVTSEQPAVQRDWVAFKVKGPLDLSQTGIMAAIATRLAQAGIPLFAVSTYETDYILTPARYADAAQVQLNLGR